MLTQILIDTHVMVVGCGALGNEVLKNLVLMGVGHIVAVDFDHVEIGNLTRSILFRKEDVGKKKTDVVARRLKEINPEVDISTIFGDIKYDVGLGLIRDMDIVISCVDSRYARYCINRLCFKVGKTWVDGGIYDLEGTVRTFRPGCNCYACSLGEKGLEELKRRMPCTGIIRKREEAGHAPTTSIIASVIGAIQVQEALKVPRPPEGAAIRQEESSGEPCYGFYYDGESLTGKRLRLNAWDEDCPHHDAIDFQQPTLTVHDSTLKVSEVLGQFGEFSLWREPFVDYIVSRKTDEVTMVMMPAHKVEDFMEHHPTLRYELTGSFYQHEITEINGDFPYMDLTLGQIGIPDNDILAP